MDKQPVSVNERSAFNRLGNPNEHLACNRNRLHPDAMILSTDRAGDPALAARLRKSLRGEVLFDASPRPTDR